MSNLLETRTQEQRRRPAPLVPGGPANRSIPIGIIATILLHAILFLGTPSTFRKPYQPPPNEYEELEFELAPEEQPPDPQQFIEANPDAPDNVPDDPKFFAAQNQQAAQEEPIPEDSDLPSTEGEDLPSTAIVTGEKAEPQESANPGQQTQPSQEVTQAQEQLQTEALMPLPGFEKVEGDDEEGIGTNIAELDQNARPVEERVEGADQPTQDQVVFATPQTTPGRPSPLPRPRLPNLRSAILSNRPGGVSLAGNIGVDANFSEFGDYLQELIEVVQAKWDSLVLATQSRPALGSQVYVRFVLNSDGEVRVVEVDEGTAGRHGTEMCLGAIRIPQKYRPWTKEMVAILGTEQELRFYFHYR